VKFSRNKRKRQECSVEAVATMIGFLPTQAIAFEWKPGCIPCHSSAFGHRIIANWSCLVVSAICRYARAL